MARSFRATIGGMHKRQILVKQLRWKINFDLLDLKIVGWISESGKELDLRDILFRVLGLSLK